MVGQAKRYINNMKAHIRLHEQVAQVTSVEGRQAWEDLYLSGREWIPMESLLKVSVFLFGRKMKEREHRHTCS